MAAVFMVPVIMVSVMVAHLELGLDTLYIVPFSLLVAGLSFLSFLPQLKHARLHHELR